MEVGMEGIRSGACLGVGSELLTPFRVDSNSLEVTRALEDAGIEVVAKAVVGDDESAIADMVRDLLGKADLVVLTGGLGPTADDVTREGVARALGRPLVEDQSLVKMIRSRYRRHGREMPPFAAHMARVVEGATVLPNRLGAAAGMLIRQGEKLVAVLPGVPHEMRQMLEDELVPYLRGATEDARVLRRTLFLAGVYESDVERRIAPLYDRFGRANVTVLCGPGVLRIVLTTRGEAGAAERRLEEMTRAFAEVVGEDLVAVDREDLAGVVLERLQAAGHTLVTAESCTGGLLGGELTAVPGSSEVYLGGVISYSNASKMRELAVDAGLLEREGAVSESVARAMAEGVRERFTATWGIGVTGIAGPGGGTADKPVGLVYWAVAGPGGTVAQHRVFPGDRQHVRRCTVSMALDLLRRELERGSGR